MIGVSLPYKWLLTGEGALCSHEQVFAELKARGATSIELRSVRPGEAEEHVLAVLTRLWDAGFTATVHSAVRSLQTAAEDVFAPLRGALDGLRQPGLTVTVHPIDGEDRVATNAAMLDTLARYAQEQGYPVTIALENNRRMPDGSEGNSVALVLEAMLKVERSAADYGDKVRLGFCFDMGHFAWYMEKFCPENPLGLPPREFLKRIVHTHIHAVNDGTTHFPLHTDPLPLDVYLPAMAYGYFGVYNVELEFPRFDGRIEPMDALTGSVEHLRGKLPPCAVVYDRVRNELDDAFCRVLKGLAGTERGTRFGLIHCTSYLFSTNGYFWGMDVAFRWAWTLAKTPSRVAELLRDLKLMLLTHSHGDHFEEPTIRALAQNDTLWIVPDFLAERAENYGIAPEKMRIARPGEPMSVGPLTVLPFRSEHFRPSNGKGVREYGYYITAPDSPSLVFPGDVRKYSREHSGYVPQADYCFAHLWLGDDNRDSACLEQVVPYADYMTGFSRKHLFLTHLYENARTDHQMWRMEHAIPVMKTLAERSPETRVEVPDWGDVRTL